MTSASIITLLSVLLLPLADNAYGEVTSVADELEGWLSAVQRRSQLLAGQPCTVTFRNTNETSLEVGAVLAQVSPASCAQGDAVVPATYLTHPRYLQKLVAGSATLVFTPRGTVTASTDTELRIRREGSAVIRCVRISAILGLISLGAGTDPSPSATSSCPEQSYSAELP